MCVSCVGLPGEFLALAECPMLAECLATQVHIAPALVDGGITVGLSGYLLGCVSIWVLLLWVFLWLCFCVSCESHCGSFECSFLLRLRPPS
jgi:hypothetical protein